MSTSGSGKASAEAAAPPREQVPQAIEGKKWVLRQRKVSGEVVEEAREEERILVNVFEVPPAYARGALGLTISLGKFEFLRVDVGADLPCYTEEIRETYVELFDIVQKELLRIKREVEDAL